MDLYTNKKTEKALLSIPGFIDTPANKPSHDGPVLVICEREVIKTVAFKKVVEEFITLGTWVPKLTRDATYNYVGDDADYCEKTDCHYWPEGWYHHNHFGTHWLIHDKVIRWAEIPEIFTSIPF